MKKRIAIITSGHPPYDERIYWKFAQSLKENGYPTTIICSTLDISTDENGIVIKGFDGNKISKKKKHEIFVSFLRQIDPAVIICAEPFTIFSAYKYKKSYKKNCKIISDITEWYPENVASKLIGIKKILTYILLFKMNILASNLADALIIGEVTKAGRYNVFASQKPKTIIGYYPILKYFNYSPPMFNGKVVTFCYAGLINFDRGILTLLEAARRIASQHRELKVRLKIIGRFQYEEEEKKFDELIESEDNIEVIKSGWTQYNGISENLSETDICFDLRKPTFIYKNSLPIKIFEYMACGKPFIFSDILPIRKELEYSKFGFLVNPEDIDAIVNQIENYINNAELLKLHSLNCRHEIESGKNWESESKKLIDFIASISEA